MAERLVGAARGRRALLRGAGARDPDARQPQLRLDRAGRARRCSARPPPSRSRCSRCARAAASRARRGRARRRLDADRRDLRDDHQHRRGEQASPRRCRRRATGSTRRPAAPAVTFLGQAIIEPEPALADRVLEPLARPRREPRRRARPAPARRSRRALASPDGTLGGYTGDPYTLAGERRRAAGAGRRARSTATRSTARRARWRLLDSEEGVYSDGWMSADVALHLLRAGRPGRAADRPLAHRLQRHRAARARRRSRSARVAHRRARATPVLGALDGGARTRASPTARRSRSSVPVAATPVAVEDHDRDRAR